MEDPDAAAVPAQTDAVLGELAGRYRLVACITGRRASAARRMVGLDQLTYAGNHGLELLGPGEASPHLDPALGHRGAAAAGFVGRLDWRRLARPRPAARGQGPIQAIHWRGAPDEAVAEQRAQGIASLASTEGWCRTSAVGCSRCGPSRRSTRGCGAAPGGGLRVDRAMFAGDDQTDRDAFSALRALERDGSLERAVCIAIASAEGPEELQREADAVVSGPTGFRELLRSL